MTKILTNIQTSQLGGIGQTFSNLIRFLNKKDRSKIKIIGVDLINDTTNHADKETNLDFDCSSVLKIVRIKANCPYFGEIIKNISCVEKLKNSYSELIDKYVEIIREEKPDLILLNGTYFVPWSLFQAGIQENIPMVLHYHGILSKETSHYEEETRQLIHQMEIMFDNDKLLYIFPSKLAKNTVEKEIFGHKIARSVVIPNPIPDYFFKIKNKNKKENIAFVGRWSRIKNPNFINNLLRYNQEQAGKYMFNIVSDPQKVMNEFSEHLKSIKLYSPMKNQRLASFYGQMGVTISPSYFETYGNVAQESIASGTPALISKQMGVSETFKQLGLSDWIVDFKSTTDVYNKIKEISGKTVSKKIKKILKSNLNSNTINNRLIKAISSA